MHKLFYCKLAASNIKKNGVTYLPYLFTCIFMVALFYIMKSLSINPEIEKMAGSDTISYTLGLGCNIVALFSIIFLFYTNSFLIKRRKKEFGVFHILGMEKKHISKVVSFEALYIAAISLMVGLLLGIALDKVMYLVIMKVLDYEIALGFYISGEAILITMILYTVIFLLILISSIWQVYLAKPIELLQSTSVGEREPKTKWLMTLLGILCLGGGYIISIVTKNPIASILMFFVAVILVILGTYLLFIAGSITFLKILKKNKKYYYQTKHFMSVAGMIYRMKQNAVGLSNICILSTMVLVMISATTSMMIGIEDIINTRYPYDLAIYSDEEIGSDKNKELELDIRGSITKTGLSIKDEMIYTYLSFAGLKKENTYILDRSVEDINSMNDIINLFFIPLSDYNKVTGENKDLAEGEILIYSNRDRHEQDTIVVDNTSYQIKEQLEEFVGNGILAANVASTHFIVVKDIKEIEHLDAVQKAVYGEGTNDIQTCYGFNVDGDKEEQLLLYNVFFETLREKEYSLSIESKAEGKDGVLSLYGGFFFIGIFLGLLFIAATVLIIYYKQISEGYEDRERFAIMQKVGMSYEEIKKSIHSQIITVFFLPLITAGVHVAFSFPIISKILEVLNLTNTSLFIFCTVCCFLAFALFYALIYALTARAYYRIVT